LSPNKRIGGLVGAFIGPFLVLTVFGTISIGLLIAVAFVGPARSHPRVDAEAAGKSRTPHVAAGGLLDRIDSLLLVLPLAHLLG
jgi:phosphatidate cytidylyltransferase